MEGQRDRFVEIATGTISNRGRCINIKDIGKEIAFCQQSKQELYRSHFFFDSTLEEHLRAYKTVRGFLGEPIIESIVLDIDKGGDTDELVHKRAVQLYMKLKELYDVDDINIRPYYSGSGFHIVLPNLWGFLSNEEVKETMSDSFPELDTIYDKTRLIRVPNTINYKTQRYKIPLELREFVNGTTPEILEAAQTPRNSFRFPDFEPNTELARFKKIPKILTDLNPMTTEGFSPIVTCMQKLYVAGPTKGSRHTSILRMVSAYKRSGIPQAGIEVMMNAWAIGQMEPGEIRKIVGDVFKQNYAYSCEDKVMKDFCDTRCMFYKKKNFNHAAPENTHTMEEKMKLFAIQGDSNVVLNLKDFLHIKTDFKIYRKEMVTLLGDTKLGKSAFAQNIAVANPKVKTLYLNFEVGETLMYRRFLQIAHIKSKKAIIEHYLQPEPSTLVGPIEHINMVSTRITIPAFEQLLATSSYDLVVVDTLECFQVPGVSEITPKTELIAHELKRIADKYNIVIMPIHHVSKSGVQNQDGSTKKLTTHAGKGSGAVEQQSDKILSFEGKQEKPLRNIRSLGARDETPFNTFLHFDAENSFRFYKIQEEAILTSSESPDQRMDGDLNSSSSFQSSR